MQLRELKMRRGSFFGSTNLKTSEPLTKLLETKKYIKLENSKAKFKEVQHKTFQNEILSKNIYHKDLH